MATSPTLARVARRRASAGGTIGNAKEGTAPAAKTSLASPRGLTPEQIKYIQAATRPYVPGTPGVRTPPVTPFLSGGQMVQHANDIGAIDDQLASIDFNLENQRINTEYQRTGIDRQLKKDTVNENDTAAYRGLFQSSIRDGDLADLNATATIRKDLLQKTLDTAELNASRTKSMLNGAGGRREQIESGYNQMKTENASAVGATQPEWQTAPTEGHYGTAPQMVPGQQPGQQPWEADPYFHQLNPLQQFSYAQYWQQNHPGGTTQSPNGFMRSDMWLASRNAGAQP